MPPSVYDSKAAEADHKACLAFLCMSNPDAIKVIRLLAHRPRARSEVVARLDRTGRSTKHGEHVVRTLLDAGLVLPLDEWLILDFEHVSDLNDYIEQMLASGEQDVVPLDSATVVPGDQE